MMNYIPTRLLIILVTGFIFISCTSSEGEQGPSTPVSEAGAPGRIDRIAFTEITKEAGLAGFRHETGAYGKKLFPESMGGGGGFIDYNDDGWLDILLVSGGVWSNQKDKPVPALRLYRNNGDGRFREVTEAAGLASVTAYGMGITVADYDNDGDDDFYFTTLHRNSLFRNDNGQFQEVGQQAGVDGGKRWSTCSIFFDADRDGHLDLYVCGYVKWPPKEEVACYLGGTKVYCPPEDFTGLAGQFFYNKGDGTFTDQTQAAGFLPFRGKTLGVAETDVDNDGWPDLVVANDSERNLFYHNKGNGTFAEKAVQAGVAYDDRGGVRGGMGIDVGDVDGEGNVTVFIGNFSEQMIGVFRQSQNLLFRDRAAASRIGHPSYLTLTFGLFLFDVDFDGDLDLFAANGHIQQRIEQHHDNVTYQQPAQLFLNDGHGMFNEAARQVGGVFTQPMVARAAAYGDVDKDGDQDILVVENGGAAHLWRNELNRSSYLRVKLEGKQSNRSAVGTRLVAVTGDMRMERYLQTGGSYLSASEQVATFGLGQNRLVDSLKVYWPNGQVDRLYKVQGGQEIRVVEKTDNHEMIGNSKTSAPNT